jgi:hypothetical protein
VSSRGVSRASEESLLAEYFYPMTSQLARRIIDAEPLGSLAFPHLAGRQRELALALSAKASIGDARRFLAQANRNEALETIFTTKKRLAQLAETLRAFDQITESWLRGDLRDRRHAWVLSSWLPGMTEHEVLGMLQEIPIELAERIAFASAFGVWLPFVSLELTVEVSLMRAGDRERLELMISRSNRRMGELRTRRPWESDYGSNTAALPTSWLYQFDPSTRSETILMRLNRSGLTNMGHLAALHPESWKLMRNSSEREWRDLKRALQKGSQAARGAQIARDLVATASGLERTRGRPTRRVGRPSLELEVILADRVLRNRRDAWQYLGGEGPDPKYPNAHITGRQLGAVEAKHRSSRGTVIKEVRITIGGRVLRNRRDPWVYLGGRHHAPKYPESHITGRQVGAIEARRRAG